MTCCPHRPAAALAALAVVGGACAACTPSSAQESVEVVASFYPLYYLAHEVGGEHVQATNITPTAADPHSLELAPSQVRDLGSADVVVYLPGMQHAVDEAVAARQPERLVDTAEAAGLERGPNGESAETSRGDAVDPHFWQDPRRMVQVAHRVADELADADPAHADDYAANADALVDELDELDQDYRTALAPCAGATLVTSHEAFGYLAARYDLDQVGISGLAPEIEPSPARLRDVKAVVEDAGVETIYFETVTSPAVAETLASDLGIRTDLLDPLGRQVDADADYFEVMRANLDALEEGLACRR